MNRIMAIATLGLVVGVASMASAAAYDNFETYGATTWTSNNTYGSWATASTHEIIHSTSYASGSYGTYGIQMRGKNDAGANAVGRLFWNQTMDSTDNLFKTYINPQNTTGRIDFKFNDGPSSAQGNVIGVVYLLGSGNWQVGSTVVGSYSTGWQLLTVELDFTSNRFRADLAGSGWSSWVNFSNVPTDGDVDSVMLYSGESKPATDVWVDYVQIIPEPVTVVLIGMGACLPLLRRRQQ